MTSELKCLVFVALRLLYEKDNYLIQNKGEGMIGAESHVSERGIVFRFGHYLQLLADQRGFLQDYNIDVEFNRNAFSTKKLQMLALKNVLPDLIVHKRGNNNDNLLVLEFKCWWNKDFEGEEDKVKLRAFINSPFNYKYAVFIALGRTRPVITGILAQDEVVIEYGIETF